MVDQLLEDDPEREPLDLEEQDDNMYVLEKESYSSNETTTDLTYFIAECVRYNVSDRAAAALYNAALCTMGELKSIILSISQKYEEKKRSLQLSTKR